MARRPARAGARAARRDAVRTPSSRPRRDLGQPVERRLARAEAALGQRRPPERQGARGHLLKGDDVGAHGGDGLCLLGLAAHAAGDVPGDHAHDRDLLAAPAVDGEHGVAPRPRLSGRASPTRSPSVASTAASHVAAMRSAARRSSSRMRSATAAVSGSPARSATRRSSS